MKKEIEKLFGRINVEIEGLSPLLMHNIENADLEKSTRVKTKKYDAKEDAEKAAYWTNNGSGKRELCVPARCVYAMLLNGGKSFRISGKSLATLMAGVIRVEPQEISLGTDKYEVDKQSVVIQKARIMRARPRLDEWKLNFDIVYHKDYIDPESIHKALESAGFRVGLLDYRPQKRGWYGTFHVTKFEVAK